MGALAVKGCTVSITSGQQASVIEITTPASSDINVGGKGVYFGDIDVSLSAITMGSLVCPSGTITIKGTASNILSGSDKAVQANDSGNDTLTFTDSSTGASSDLPVAIQISDPGQTDVIAL
jgi:hypothetical protein